MQPELLALRWSREPREAGKWSLDDEKGKETDSAQEPPETKATGPMISVPNF